MEGKTLVCLLSGGRLVYLCCLIVYWCTCVVPGAKLVYLWYLMKGGLNLVSGGRLIYHLCGVWQYIGLSYDVLYKVDGCLLEDWCICGGVWRNGNISVSFL